MLSKYETSRFIKAQDTAYKVVLAELQSGCKQSHWIWYIFPQLAALGSSATAKFYGIKNLEEAKEYFNHPILGPRLIECTTLLLGIKDKSAFEILGTPDDLKLKSCMTLFGLAAPYENLFNEVLSKFYNAEKDLITIELCNGFI